MEEKRNDSWFDYIALRREAGFAQAHLPYVVTITNTSSLIVPRPQS
jgi:hypothetical protein